MYKYANEMNMSINKISNMVLINFLQNTPALDSDCDFVETDEMNCEVVSSVALDKEGAYHLLNGLIHVLGLDQ